MTTLIWGRFIAFIVSGALIPVAGGASKYLGAVSEVGGRNVGEVPIGRVGGLGVIIGVFASMAWQIIFDDSVELAVS
jgi:UDP-N-acetylmuramyl pentapeptide phosphotransferase/UDP-N-acetylglucosamine-1-phosphate transferase